MSGRRGACESWICTCTAVPVVKMDVDTGGQSKEVTAAVNTLSHSVYSLKPYKPKRCAVTRETTSALLPLTQAQT